MSIDVDKEKQRLAQAQFLKSISRQVRPTEMLTVYLKDRNNDRDITVYCALVPSNKIETVLGRTSWDLHLGNGLPGAIEYHGGSGYAERVEYFRSGRDDGVEPLVIYRHFHGMRDPYVEINEEFRLFHNLYHDRKQEKYIKIDNSGNEHIVVVVQPNCVQIRLQEIKQFLAIKEMHLAIMFDCREHSRATVGVLGLQAGAQDHRSGLLVYSLAYGDLYGSAGKHAFSRLLGKLLVPPCPKEESGLWGFAPEEPKKHVDFIIEVDHKGKEVAHTSDPDQLANYFGANPGEPHYLRPVHFRKEVLDKYYQQPRKYSVKDGYLRCGGLWGMTIDNHHEDKVVAWLGDLGRDLPYEEQLHWRSYNIPPAGGVSETFFKRQLLAQFADSDQPEHVFRYRYERLQEACKEKLGWQLLLPLSPEDVHYFDSVRVPATDEQKDFDDLVLALTKILVDSLNDKEVNKLIPAGDGVQPKGSIWRLEKALAAQGVKGAEDHIKFLRNLQDLRSSGTAHRKGSSYRKIAEEFGVDRYTLRSVFQGILTKACSVLEFLEGVVRSGVLILASEASASGGTS